MRRATSRQEVAARPGGGARRRAFLAALFLATGLGTAGASPRIEAGALEPFAWAAATIRDPEGLPGSLSLVALVADGGSVPVFRAEPEGWVSSLEARFFVPDGTVGLELRDAATGFALARAGAGQARDDAPALGRRRLLRSLDFPLRGAGGGTPPARFDPGPADPARVAREAVSTLFVAPRRPAAIAALALWTCVAAAGAALLARRGRKAGRVPVAALLAACLVAAAFSAALGAPAAARWELALPEPLGDEGFVATLAPPASEDGVRALRWSVPAPGPLALLAFHDPAGSGIDVEPWARGSVRFSSHPEVELAADGRYRIVARRFVAAWRLDDAP